MTGEPEHIDVCRSCLGHILKEEVLVRDRKGNPLRAYCEGED